jgi:hypothetical protein
MEVNFIRIGGLGRSGEALLVCSYDDERCKTMLVEVALLRSEFEDRVPVKPKDQEIIFY